MDHDLCHQIIQVDSQNKDYGNLFLGGLKAVKKEKLESKCINFVLTVLDKYVYQLQKLKDTIGECMIAQHKWIDTEDSEQQSIGRYFQQTFQWIDECLKKGNVLVHCQAGRSRSASIVIYYVMKKQRLSLEKANKIVVSKRYIVSPNEGFWQQLVAAQKQLNLFDNQNIILNKAEQKKEKNEKLENLTIFQRKSEFQNEKYPQKFANHIICIDKNECNMQKGNLFLGQFSILKSHFIEALKIKSVISVVDSGYRTRMKLKEIVEHIGFQNYLWLDVKDQPGANIGQYFQQTFNFINQHLEVGNVLVHCQAGVSRSASVVIAFIVKKFGLSFEQSLKFVQGKRSVVNPNHGFQTTLGEYSEKYCKKQQA